MITFQDIIYGQQIGNTLPWICFWFIISLAEAPVEEIAVIKRDGKLYVDAFDGTGENVVTAEQPSESGRARK